MIDTLIPIRHPSSLLSKSLMEGRRATRSRLQVPRRRSTNSRSVGLEAIPVRQNRASVRRPRNAGQGTPTAGSSQAKPSSSLPSLLVGD